MYIPNYFSNYKTGQRGIKTPMSKTMLRIIVQYILKYDFKLLFIYYDYEH